MDPVLIAELARRMKILDRLRAMLKWAEEIGDDSRAGRIRSGIKETDAQVSELRSAVRDAKAAERAVERS